MFVTFNSLFVLEASVHCTVLYCIVSKVPHDESNTDSKIHEHVIRSHPVSGSREGDFPGTEAHKKSLCLCLCYLS
jgi:hypothetical protein